MQDPTRRDAPGSWPRDRPVRWGALGRNLTSFAARTSVFVVQFALIVPILTLPADAAGGWLQAGVAVAWGVGTLWAAWCWLLGDPRGVIAPVLTLVAILAAGSSGSGG